LYCVRTLLLSMKFVMPFLWEKIPFSCSATCIYVWEPHVRHQFSLQTALPLCKDKTRLWASLHGHTHANSVFMLELIRMFQSPQNVKEFFFFLQGEKWSSDVVCISSICCFFPLFCVYKDVGYTVHFSCNQCGKEDCIVCYRKNSST
jgi:hypothetical protein